MERRHAVVVVAYVPNVLRNMREICEKMGVGERTVKRWIAQGAPIAVEGDARNTRYSAELARLQCWREANSFPPDTAAGESQS